MSCELILVISHDVAGKRSAGPGIRYRELARVLARHFAVDPSQGKREVILAVPDQPDLENQPFAIWPYQRGRWDTLARVAHRAGVIVAPGDSLADFPALAHLSTPLIVDGYDPHSLETLALWAEQPIPIQAARHGERLDILRRQCQAGDFFICASQRQRDWWLGLLEDQGRVNPHTYGSDPSLQNLIDVVPFGLPSEPPSPKGDPHQAARPVVRGVWPGVGPDDWIVLWGGGLWEWLDPLTALRAVRRLADGGHDIRLVFPGTRHPNPAMPDMPMRARTMALADELGLTGRYAFFGDWVPYEDWPAVLLEADVGLSLHPDTVEARLAFRSRVLDYVWAGLPMVVTCGDSAADLVENHALGLTVNYGDDAAVAAALANQFRAGRPALRDAYRERFDTARRDLTWERAAEPLVAFCHEPHLAADKAPHAVQKPAFPRSGAGTDGTKVELMNRESSVKQKPSFSVIVLTWNVTKYVEGCLEALLAQDYPAFEVLVADNGSTDGTPDLVARRFPQVRVLRNQRNLGFAAGNNVGLRAANSDLLVLLNADTQVQPGWLTALADAFDDPIIGVAGCKLLYPDGSIQHAGGFVYGPRGEADHLGRYAPDDGRFDNLTDVEYATGAALAIRRIVLEQIGLLDEGFSPIYYEDTDLCFRARAAGWRVVCVPDAIVTHYESTTFSAETYERKSALHQGRLRFLFKHRPVDWLLEEFGPAESAWVRGMDRTEELMAARHAYLSTLLALPEILAFRRSSSQDAEALVRLLADLRAAAVAGLAAQHAPPALQSSPQSLVASSVSVVEEQVKPSETSPIAVDAAPEQIRDRYLAELEAVQVVRERPFTSNVPVLGRLFVAVRSLWNSISTKWYVRPLIQQQTDFNIRVVGYLRIVQEQFEIIGWLSRRVDQLEIGGNEQGRLLQGQLRDAAQNIRELTVLAEQVAALKARLTAEAQDRSDSGREET
jgi:GT2 family glycosyltransferase/glycosyltransferase involved in cell wall biosynthesis